MKKPCCGGDRGVLRTVAHGAAGLARAALSVDRVTRKVKEARLVKCRACEFSTKTFKDGKVIVNRCTICKCFLGPKAGDQRETCEEGKWEIETGKVVKYGRKNY